MDAWSKSNLAWPAACHDAVLGVVSPNAVLDDRERRLHEVRIPLDPGLLLLPALLDRVQEQVLFMTSPERHSVHRACLYCREEWESKVRQQNIDTQRHEVWAEWMVR